MRIRVQELVESRVFGVIIIVAIVVNALILGLELSPSWMADFGQPTRVINAVTLVLFVVELALRLYAYGWKFFRSGWNVFDFVVVALALTPSAGGSSVLRILRILRVLRLLSTVRSMRLVVSALVATIPGMASIGALLTMLLYMSSVIATQLFAGADPEHFGTLTRSLRSMFQVMTGDDWANVIAPTTSTHPWAYLFFVFYIVLATYIVLNLFIAVAVEALDRETSAEEAASGEGTREHDEIVIALARLRDEMELLRTEVGSRERG